MSKPAEKNDELYRKAIEVYGPAGQLNIAVEECAEFIKAVMKINRAAHDPEMVVLTKEKLIEECADVLVAFQSVRLLLGRNEVDKAISDKMKRLEFRLGSEG